MSSWLFSNIIFLYNPVFFYQERHGSGSTPKYSKNNLMLKSLATSGL